MMDEREDIDDDLPGTPDVPEVPPVKEWSDDEEFEAKALGWKAEDEWKGDKPAGYIADPREYLRRAETFGPFRKLKEKLDRQEEHLRRVESIAAKQVERAQKEAEERFNQRLNAIQAEKRKAAQEGDLERYDHLSKTEATLERPRPEPVQAEPQDALLPEIKERHKWVNDPYLRSRAAEIVENGYRIGELPKEGVSQQQQAEYAETRLKTYYPHLFQTEQKPPPKASPVEAGGVGTVTKRSGFATLPQDAKDAFKRLVSQGVFKDTDEDRRFYHDEYTNG